MHDEHGQPIFRGEVINIFRRRDGACAGPVARHAGRPTRNEIGQKLRHETRGIIVAAPLPRTDDELKVFATIELGGGLGLWRHGHAEQGGEGAQKLEAHEWRKARRQSSHPPKSSRKTTKTNAKKRWRFSGQGIIVPPSPCADAPKTATLDFRAGSCSRIPAGTGRATAIQAPPTPQNPSAHRGSRLVPLGWDNQNLIER